MKYFGIDHGEKKWGLSKADEKLKIAVPIGKYNEQEIIKYIRENTNDNKYKIIIGLPYSMSGRFSTQTFNVIKSAVNLKNQLKCDIHLVDERLTSRALYSETKGKVSSKKIKQNKDMNSSVLILNSYLNNSNYIDLKIKEIHNIDLSIENKQVLVYNVGIKNELNNNIDLYIKDPYLFYYYFKRGIKSTTILNDLKKEYDVLLKNKNEECNIKSNQIINL